MNFYKPFFKKIVYLNEILVKNYKILKFKNKKWLPIIIFIKKQLISNRLNKFKLIDQEKLLLDYYSNKVSNSYKFNYKFYFTILKRLKILYCNKFQKIVIVNFKNILNLLERRIDINIVKSKFVLTLRNAKKIIICKYIYLNQRKITIKSYLLNSGDFIKLKLFTKKYRELLINSLKYSLPNHNIVINYKTKEFLFINLLKLTKLILSFPYYLNLNKIFI